MRKITEILRLKFGVGLSIRAVALFLNIGHGTVSYTGQNDYSFYRYRQQMCQSDVWREFIVYSQLLHLFLRGIPRSGQHY